MEHKATEHSKPLSRVSTEIAILERKVAQAAMLHDYSTYDMAA